MLVQEKLSTIVAGMEIYDISNEKVGTIDSFRLGKGIIASNKTADETIEEALKKIIGDNEFPTDLNSELYEAGFLYIERGFLRDNVIVFPHQIGDIVDDAIHLNVDEDDLLTV